LKNDGEAEQFIECVGEATTFLSRSRSFFLLEKSASPYVNCAVDVAYKNFGQNFWRLKTKYCRMKTLASDFDRKVFVLPNIIITLTNICE
jgi:hypothetical protein